MNRKRVQLRPAKGKLYVATLSERGFSATRFKLDWLTNQKLDDTGEVIYWLL